MLAAGPADVTSNLVVMPLPVQPSSCNVAVQMLTVMHAISGNIKGICIALVSGLYGHVRFCNREQRRPSLTDASQHVPAEAEKQCNCKSKA